MVGHDAILARFSEARAEYAAAAPFPYAVFTDLFDDGDLRAVAAEFAAPGEMSRQFDRTHEVKSAEEEWSSLGPATRSFIAELNSAPFLRALTALTGIEPLLSDPLLEGGGQHQIPRGGKLALHADFNAHYTYGFARRLNVLVYLNEDWRPEWGGQLELWEEEADAATVTVEPGLNTTVVFSTSDRSFHGHPATLECPADRTRKSIALYYYTPAPPGQEVHSTVFRTTPEDHRLRVRVEMAVPHLKRAARALFPRR